MSRGIWSFPQGLGSASQLLSTPHSPTSIPHPLPSSARQHKHQSTCAVGRARAGSLLCLIGVVSLVGWCGGVGGWVDGREEGVRIREERWWGDRRGRGAEGVHVGKRGVVVGGGGGGERERERGRKRGERGVWCVWCTWCVRSVGGGEVCWLVHVFLVCGECCASCVWFTYLSRYTRVCGLNHVRLKSLCSLFQKSDSLLWACSSSVPGDRTCLQFIVATRRRGDLLGVW